jgi:hypothetical protein
MNAVVNITRYRTVQVALAGVLRGFEVPVAVIPRQQHVFSEVLARRGIGQLHGGAVIRQRYLRLQRQGGHTGSIVCSG